MKKEVPQGTRAMMVLKTHCARSDLQTEGSCAVYVWTQGAAAYNEACTAIS